MAVLPIVARYVHILSAVLMVGGAFFLAFFVPQVLRMLDEAAREQALRKIRRGFKMVVHPAGLFLILTGIYNSYRNWGDYKLDTARMHAWWGPHVILGFAAIAVLSTLLAARAAKPAHARWLRWAVLLMLLVIACASVLSVVRLNVIKSRQSAMPDNAEASSGVMVPQTPQAAPDAASRPAS